MDEKISKMMNELNEKYICEQDLNEYTLDELEFERIYKAVVRRYQNKPTKSKKRMRRLILIAAVLVIGSSSIWAVNNGSFFEQIFKKNVSNLGDSGQVVELSDEKQNIKVTIDGVVGYEKKLAIIYEIQKTDGIPFKENDLDVKGYIEIEGEGEKAKYYIDAVQSKEISREKTPTKRVYMATLSTMEENVVGFTDEQGRFEEKDYGQVNSFIGKEAKVVITEITEKYRGDNDAPDIPLIDLVNQVRMQEQLPFDQKKYEMRSHTGDENAKPDIEAQHMLPYGRMDKLLYQRKPRLLIDNIGFIDGQLHIRLCGKLKAGEDRRTFYRNRASYNLRLLDERGNTIPYSLYSNYDESDKSRWVEEYYVFDIKDLENLKQDKAVSYIDQEIKTTKDEWEIPFTIILKNCKETILTNQLLPAYNKEIAWKVNDIQLSNISMDISLISINKKTGQTAKHQYNDNCVVSKKVKLIFKDGTEREYNGHTYGTWIWDGGYENEWLDADFGINIFMVHAIDPKEVNAIEIAGIKIPVNE